MRRGGISAVVLAFVTVASGGERRCWALGSGATALADVAVLSPPAGDALITEAVTRLRAELGAAGLTSHLVSCVEADASGPNACATPPPAPSVATVPGTTSAVVALARDEGVTTIEVIERLPDGSSFFRLVYVPVREGGRDPVVLGIRGVELLRDLHMDIERGVATPSVAVQAAPPRRPPDGVLEAAPTPREERAAEPDPDLERDRRLVSPERGPWQVGLSLAGLRGRDGLGPSIGAALDASFAAKAWLAVFALGSGLFFDDLRAAAGTANARQEMALAGLRASLPRARLRPYVAAGLGLVHIKVTGTAPVDRQYTTTASSLLTPALAAGVGAAFRATRFVDVRLEVDTVWTATSGTITIVGDVVGRVGAPSFLALGGVWICLP